MRSIIPTLLVCISASALASEPEIHRITASGNFEQAGYPKDQIPKLLVIAEKPFEIHLQGGVSDWNTQVQLYQTNSTRKISLKSPEMQFDSEVWKWSWTPPFTKGIANYEIHFRGAVERVVRIESRDATWVKSMLEKLGSHVSWEAEGISSEERDALLKRGVRMAKLSEKPNDRSAELRIIPKLGDGSRRRVVLDSANPDLIVWRPGPVAGDLEVRAPRWWISPQSLASDQGLIRFLDLFTDLPLNP